MILDISGALASIGQLDDALQSVVTNFGGQLNAALADLQAATVTVDTSALTGDVESAISAVTTPVPVEGDVSGLESDIASAAAQPLDITADTTGLESDITTAIGDANTVVPVEGDTTGLASDIESASAQPVELNIDTGAVTGDITAAIGDVSAPVAVEGDTSALDSAIADALDQPRPPLLVEGDTTELTDAIDSATTGLSTTIPLDGDTSALSDAIDFATSVTSTVPVDADVTAAQDAINGLTAQPIEATVTADTTEAQQAIDDLQAATASASGGVDSLSGGIDALSAASGVAKGEVGELGGFISNISPASAAATTGVVALGGFIAAAANAAADAQAQNKRFADTFGILADQVNRINVGGLVTNIKDLGVASGTSNADLEATASRIGSLGKTSGAANANIVGTTQKLLALGATISVNNPRLGDAAVVTDRLGAALARGGRALVPFGIGLTSAQINQEAFNETGKTSAATLTTFEKITAGANLAVKQFGGSLGKDFADGAANAQIQLQSLKVQLEETLVAVGGPLLQPLTADLKELLPVAQQTGLALGALAGDVLPLLGALGSGLSIVSGPLGAITDGLDALGPAGLAAAAGLAILAPDLVLVAAGFGSATVTATAFGVAIDFLTGPIGLTLVALAGLGLAARSLKEHEHEVASATKDWTDALFGASSGAQSLDQQVAQLDTNIGKQTATFIEGQKAGSAFRNALDGIGGGAKGLATALGGTEEQFDKYKAAVTEATVVQDIKGHASFVSLQHDLITSGKSLDIQREALQGSVEGQIASLRTTNQLTDAQLKHIDSQFHLNTATADYVGALKEANVEADRNLAVQQKANDAAVAQSGAIKDVANSVKSGTITLADAKTVSDQYAISIGKATQLITDAEFAQDRHAASVVQGTTAFNNLIDGIARGNITIPDATAKLVALHFSEDGAATAAKALQSSIASAVSGIVGNLPTASDAIKTWHDDAAAAFKDAADQIDKHGKHIRQTIDNFRFFADPARLAGDLNQQTAQIIQFQNNLVTLVHEGFGRLAGFIAKQPFDVSGPLAAGFASDRAKAALTTASLGLGETVTATFQNFINTHASQLGLVVGTDIGNGVIVGAPPLNAAVERVGAGLAQHFHPDFTGRISTSVNAAAAALAADPTIGQAAGRQGLVALQQFEAHFGPADAADAARIALAGAHAAIQADPSLAAASAKKGTETSDALKRNFKVAQGVQDAINQAADIVPGLDNLPNVAGVLGVRAGDAFGSGMENGILGREGAVIAAATRIANAAAIAVAVAHITTSPSKVAMRLGRQFTEGLAIGLTEDIVGVTRAATNIASAITSSSGLAFAAAGRTAVNQIVAGFNDPATVAAAIATLKQLVAQATATAANTGEATTQFSSFVSSVISQLPAGASAISNFGQTISSDLSAQSSALDGVHKAYTAYHEDLAKSRRLAHDAGIAYGALVVAQQRLNAAVAAHAPKNVIAELTDSLKAAQSNLDSLSNKLDSARSRVSSDQSNIADSTKQLHEASHQLAVDTNPATFVKNLNAQTAANREFQRNIAKLAREGFTDLAQQLAAAGPETAGKLAKGLASKPALAKSAEAAIDHAKRFSDSFEAFLVKTFGPKVAATVATVGQHAGTAIGSDLIAITDTATHTAVTNVNAQLNAVAPEIRVTVDTSSVTTGLEQLPTSAPLTVIPSLGHLAIPPFPAVTLPLTPTFGPLPPIAPLTVQVQADVAPIAEQTIEVRPDLNPPLPQFAPMRLDVIPDVGPLPSASLSVEPVLDPLPALAPISVRVIPIVDQLPPGLTAALQPHLTAVAPVATVVAPAPTSQTLELDLSITIPDGTVLTATKTVTVPINRSATKTKIGAAVQAKVRA